MSGCKTPDNKNSIVGFLIKGTLSLLLGVTPARQTEFLLVKSGGVRQFNHPVYMVQKIEIK